MSDHLLVAAIDFGTTYSGYAFSTIANFKLDPLKIHANQAWNAGGRQLLSLKTPTCLLLNEKKELVSFGYEAENDYAELVLDEKHHDHYYFTRFKMRLYQAKDLSEEMRLEDVTGKSLMAIDVFGQSIKALRDHLLKLLDTEGTSIKQHEIKWVLTVPAIWPDSAKQFMRKSAEKAGIEDSNLFIALEPEAASIHCQYLPTGKLKGATEGLTMTETGQKYMVVDLGGGTADLTVHEKLEGGHLKELCHASGGDCGGTSVDNAFIQMMVKILGAPMINLLKQEDPSAYLDLLREFETVKRKIEPTTSGKVNFTIPCATINALCEKHQNESLLSMIQASPFADQITLRGDKLRVDADVMKTLFEKTINNIIKLVKDILRKSSAQDVPLLLLVGGFAECPLIQSAMGKEFSEKRIIIPEEAGISVLKGAVLFGHKPDYIASRVMQFSYGTDISKTFDPDRHSESHKKVVNGKERCRNIFSVIIGKDRSVPIGTKIRKSYNTIHKNQKWMTINIYASNKKNPSYVDEEDCHLIGKAGIDIPSPSEEKRSVEVEFILGNTELSMTAKEDLYGSTCEANFKLI
ncbi:heat shock 70 kDa protein 12A-like [Mytilus galloprovincialis]|uniref:heat shock 70 kDa protein 12A-like n=1 Tax=Mytilus galloprovincialis TaxID=29158 RepID=UPI003F7C26C6